MGILISENFTDFKSKIASFLVPAYNADQYIIETLNSLSNQTYTDFNILVIDDGSSDSTLSLLLEYDDDRLYVLKNEKNIRLVATLNKGLDVLTSKYIIRMDADDLITYNRLEKLISFMEKNPQVDICGSALQYIGKRRDVIRFKEKNEEIKASIPFHSIMPHATVIFKTSHLEKFGIRYSERHIHMEDADLWFRIHEFTHFSNISEVLYFYRWEGQNITQKTVNTRFERELVYFSNVYSKLGIPVTKEQIANWIKKNTSKKLKRKSISNSLKFLQQIDRWNDKKHYFEKEVLNKKIMEEKQLLFHKACDSGFIASLGFLFHPNFYFRNARYFISKAILKR